LACYKKLSIDLIFKFVKENVGIGKEKADQSVYPHSQDWKKLLKKKKP
jgi:hypothetical protein